MTKSLLFCSLGIGVIVSILGWGGAAANSPSVRELVFVVGRCHQPIPDADSWSESCEAYSRSGTATLIYTSQSHAYFLTAAHNFDSVPRSPKIGAAFRHHADLCFHSDEDIENQKLYSGQGLISHPVRLEQYVKQNINGVLETSKIELIGREVAFAKRSIDHYGRDIPYGVDISLIEVECTSCGELMQNSISEVRLIQLREFIPQIWFSWGANPKIDATPIGLKKRDYTISGYPDYGYNTQSVPEVTPTADTITPKTVDKVYNGDADTGMLFVVWGHGESETATHPMNGESGAVLIDPYALRTSNSFSRLSRVVGLLKGGGWKNNRATTQCRIFKGQRDLETCKKLFFFTNFDYPGDVWKLLLSIRPSDEVCALVNEVTKEIVDTEIDNDERPGNEFESRANLVATNLKKMKPLDVFLFAWALFDHSEAESLLATEELRRLADGLVKGRRDQFVLEDKYWKNERVLGVLSSCVGSAKMKAAISAVVPQLGEFIEQSFSVKQALSCEEKYVAIGKRELAAQALTASLAAKETKEDVQFLVSINKSITEYRLAIEYGMRAEWESIETGDLFLAKAQSELAFAYTQHPDWEHSVEIQEEARRLVLQSSELGMATPESLSVLADLENTEKRMSNNSEKTILSKQLKAVSFVSAESNLDSANSWPFSTFAPLDEAVVSGIRNSSLLKGASDDIVREIAYSENNPYRADLN